VLLALVVAVLAVALGAALTAVSGTRPTLLGLLRTFAATAAAVVVLTHLLPDALNGTGLWGALAFLVGLLAPQALHSLNERLVSPQPGLTGTRLALEAGFIGLLVHHVGDGLGIGAYAALPGGVLEHLNVIVALVAHTVPLVAVVTLAYRRQYGSSVAWRRAGALAVASAVGVLVSFAVPTGTLLAASAWIGALVGGVLLHVVTHDWLENLPQSEGSRALDLVAAGLGLSLVLLGGHEPGHADAGHELLESALVTAERTAPFLVIGVALTFLLGNRLNLELAKLGQSLPIRVGRRFCFAFGADGLTLGLSTYGVVWTLGALVATALVPLVAGAVAMLAVAIAGEDAAKRTATQLANAPIETTDRLRRFDRSTAIWIVAVALAAVFHGALRDGALLGSIGSPGELVVTGALGTLLGTGGPSVVALGALTDKGLSPGAALLGALLSSALGLGALRSLTQQLGPRALLATLVWLVCLTAAISIGVNQIAPIPNPLQFPGSVSRASLLLVLLLILVRAERVGVRRWLAGWFVDSLDAAHHHHHGHDHGRAHHHSSESPKGSAATTRSPEASGPSAEA
jgi:hypothetical protein